MDEIKDEIKIEPAIEEETPEEQAKPSNKNFFILLASIFGVLIIIFALFFIKGQFFTGQVVTIDDLHQKNLENKLDSEQGYVYNGFSFVFVDGLWYTRLQNQEKVFEIPLHFGPRDLEDVKIVGGVDQSFNQGEDVYLTFNPLSQNMKFISLSSSELAQNIVTGIQRRPVAACDRNETSACSDRPIVNCSNTQQPVIYLLQEPGPEIELNKNCITIKGVGYDLVKATDRLILQWYGIMS